jgi:hypothetical protein
VKEFHTNLRLGTLSVEHKSSQSQVALDCIHLDKYLIRVHSEDTNHMFDALQAAYKEGRAALAREIAKEVKP